MMSIPDQMINARLVRSMLSFKELAFRGGTLRPATAFHEPQRATARKNWYARAWGSK